MGFDASELRRRYEARPRAGEEAMPRYIITYDLHAPGQNYEALKERIKSYPRWAKLMRSTWSVVTPETVEQIRDHLKPALDGNDKLLVGVLGRSAWYGLSSKVTKWLKAET